MNKIIVSTMISAAMLSTTTVFAMEGDDNEGKFTMIVSAKTELEFKGEKLQNASNVKAAIDAFIEVKQISNILTKAEECLKREIKEVEECKMLAEAGKKIQKKDYTSTLANFHNGHATLQDAYESEIKSGLHADPVTCAREEVQQQREKLIEAKKRFYELLNTSEQIAT